MPTSIRRDSLYIFACQTGSK